MSTEDTQPTDTRADVADVDALDCRECATRLQKNTSVTSRNRSTTVHCCPNCGFGAVALVDQEGALAELMKKELQNRREAIAYGLSAYRLAAFVSEGCPTGRYRIERRSDHVYQLSVPERMEASQLGPLADRISAAADHLIVQQRLDGPALTITDTRLSERVDEQDRTATDGGSSVAMPSTGGPQALPPVRSDDDPRAKRAKRENMDISLLEKGGRYEVRSESGNTYEVDVLDETCTCPDDHDRCKHRRRVEMAIDCHRVPRPDGRLPTDS